MASGIMAPTGTLRVGVGARCARTSPRPPRHRRGWLVLVVAVGLLAACSDDDGSSADGGTTEGGAEVTGTTGAEEAPTDPDGEAPDPERYDGPVDGFYEVPDPLPPGAPGDLIRVQELGEEEGARSFRVMYHSVDAQGRDRAVTGVVTHPVAPAPEGGWPVVAWAHGTTGLASPCAPSRDGTAAPDFGVDSVVRVATDYIGLGPVGERHPYLSGPSQAHSVIDAVRAARRLPDSGAGERWVAVGHSQGGHAALFTNQLAAEHAPELELAGTAVIAPAAALEETFGPADEVIPRMVGVMALYGLAADHPDLDPEDYVGDEVAAADEVIDTGCLDDVVAAFVAIPEDEFYENDPLETEPAASILRENDPGRVAVDSPLLLVYGEADGTVVPARVDFLFDQLCDVGQDVEMVAFPGDHGTVVPQSAPTIAEWFGDRLAGEPVPDGCVRGEPVG